MLFDAIEKGTFKRCEPGKEIERVMPLNLEARCWKRRERILSLIEDEGYSPSDIVVISNYADPVSEFVIARSLEKHAMKLKTLHERAEL